MQHCEREAGRVKKFGYWIHSAARWSTTHPTVARIRTSANHPEYKVSQREIQLG